LLSDGTLRVLAISQRDEALCAIAAAMLSATEGSLVVIEEIDNGVHPNRAKHLLASIRDIAEQRKLRVLLSTHNPALMDALPDAKLYCQYLSSGAAMETISIQVDANIAKAFQSAQPEEQQKIQSLVSLWLKRAMNLTSLQTTMDHLSNEAEANGLTPEILESILNE